MEAMQDTMYAGSGDTKTFINHVFDFNQSNKDHIFNIIQYTFLTIIPVIIILKVIKNYFPEENYYKSSVTILIEIVAQILFILASFWIIHRVVIYFPTYSGSKYEDVNFLTMMLPLLFILLTLQTKLGAKVNILFNRLSKQLGFKNMENMENEEDGRSCESNQPNQLVNANCKHIDLRTR